MLAAIASAAVVGIDAYHVVVEVDVAAGLPQWTIVGLPAGAVRESRETVSAAVVDLGFQVAPRRVTIYLAPADTRDDGAAFRLPHVLVLFMATGHIRKVATDGSVARRELERDGSGRPGLGVLAVARRLTRTPTDPTHILPLQNVTEAALVSYNKVSAAESLAMLVDALRHDALSAPPAVA